MLICSRLRIVKSVTNIFSSQDFQIWLTKNMRYRCLRYATHQYNSTENVIFKPWVHNSTCVIQFPEYIILTLDMKCFRKIMIIWPDAFERWSMSIMCVFFSNGIFILYVMGWIIIEIRSFNNLVGISSWPWPGFKKKYHIHEHTVHLQFWSPALKTCICVWNSMTSLDIYFV